MHGRARLRVPVPRPRGVRGRHPLPVQDEAATIAGADRACAADSRLITVYREVFDEQLAVVREQYREQLDRYLALRDQAIRGL